MCEIEDSVPMPGDREGKLSRGQRQGNAMVWKGRAEKTRRHVVGVGDLLEVWIVTARGRMYQDVADGVNLSEVRRITAEAK